ncbi:MAG: GMC family oxidoreductase [Thaumarchaeota archaeon]|nr:GMC family oxidoreductase [Nitrososphaerota archaeon]
MVPARADRPRTDRPFGGLRLIIPGREVSGPVTERTDVCVIGSGAAGAIVAWEMAEQGHKVVLLEKGGYHPRQDFTQREDQMIPMLFKNCGLQFTIPDAIAVAQGSCVGGSTVVNDAVCFRTPDTVLGWWKDDHKVEGVDPAAMKRHFEKVEPRISVTEVLPFELNRNNLILKDGCEKLGWAGAPNKRNCRDCRQCGLCHLGCYYGTKQSMLETYIADIERVHGESVKIYADAGALELARSGSRVTGVGASVDGGAGTANPLNVKADLFVVCAGTIGSSELLLKSGLDINRRVGRNVAIHPSAALIGDFPEEVRGHEGIPMAYHCYEFSVLKTGKRGFMLESISLPPYQFSLPLPGFGFDHKELMSRYEHYGLMGAMVHDQSVGRARLGGPLGTILEYELAPEDAKILVEGMRNATRLLLSQGATRVITSQKKKTVVHGEEDMYLIRHRGVSALDINLASAHPQGGNAMGGDPKRAVVDSNSRAYGFENLFVCDASVFPTAVGVNPQLTVMALASRLGEHIGESWAKYAGGS